MRMGVSSRREVPTRRRVQIARDRTVFTWADVQVRLSTRTDLRARPTKLGASAETTASAATTEEAQLEQEETGEEEAKGEVGEDDAECELVLGKELELGAGASKFGAHLAEAVKNRNGSGVLLLTDVEGYQNDETREFAYRLACFGYSVLVPDLFRGKPWDPSRPKETEFDEWRSSHPSERVESDIDMAASYLSSTLASYQDLPGKGRMSVLGFCFGGGRLIETLARDDEGRFSAGVFFYGTRFETSLGAKIKVPLLLITGDSDPLCSEEDVRQVAQGVAESKVAVFTERGHAFAHHPKTVEEDEDAEEAFIMAKKWLHDHLLEGAPGPWAEDIAS
eukprot:TRINITY_DN1505_c0_g2_i1.p1 TRINITY_DN1505_c0_g2~~TRINITY_DN1505_c0_g2_i1.p1  ORF type:complete len:336 (+),score=60.43 TRINITY_DN1505_c0_g2_i1:266-1273(+)